MSKVRDEWDADEVTGTDPEGANDDVPSAPSAKVFQFVKEGKFDQATKQLEAAPELWQEVESDGYTLLHWAALAGHKEFAAKVLAAGVQVDVLAANGQTPLMWAVIRGHVQAARLLIEAGAGIYVRDSFGATSLILSIQHQQHAAFMLLVGMADRAKLFAQIDDNGCGPVHWAAYKGDMTTLKLLDYFDVDFLGLDNTRMTALHRAVQSSQSSVIEFILDKEVDPSLRESQGKTCMDLAEANQDMVMTRVLKRYLDVSKGDGSVVMEGAQQDLEAGGRKLTRKVKTKEKKQMDELRDKAVGWCAAAFWLVCVSLSVFQYINDLRMVCWMAAPRATMIFEMGVPASLLLFFTTAFSDPGKVPPRVMGHSGVEDLMRVFSTGSPSDIEKTDIARLCTTTWVIKGLRTKYCKVTGACVDEFDHFCGWLNAAIGKGNHRYFMCLAVTEVFTQLCFVYISWHGAGQLVKASSFGTWMAGITASYPLLALLVIIHGFTVPGVMMLTFYQLRLVAVNLLTNEMLNAHRYKHFWQETEGATGSKRKVFKNPFCKGNVVLNMVDFWWARRRSEIGPGVTIKTMK